MGRGVQVQLVACQVPLEVLQALQGRLKDFGTHIHEVVSLCIEIVLLYDESLLDKDLGIVTLRDGTVELSQVGIEGEIEYAVFVLFRPDDIQVLIEVISSDRYLKDHVERLDALLIGRK